MGGDSLILTATTINPLGSDGNVTTSRERCGPGHRPASGLPVR